MRAVIQRVKKGGVTINKKLFSSINSGLLILIGIEENDNNEDSDWLVKKIINLRIFDDEDGIMNKSILDIKGEILVVSQFTLHALYKKGNRPSYIRAAKPEKAIPLYNSFIKNIESESNLVVKTGEFAANMQVELINDGPVTILIDTKNKE